MYNQDMLSVKDWCFLFLFNFLFGFLVLYLMDRTMGNQDMLFKEIFCSMTGSAGAILIMLIIDYLTQTNK